MPIKNVHLVRDRKGSAILMLALALPVIVMVLSLGVDYARTLVARQKLQNAADTTTLAVVKRSILDGGLGEEDLAAFGRDYLAAQFDGVYRIDGFDIDPSVVTAELSLTGSVSGLFTRIFKTDILDYKVNSAATIGRTAIEVALVLDTSRSISDAELSALKASAMKLVDEIIPPSSAGSAQTTVSLVPFAGMVRLPVSERGEWWIDAYGGGAPHHFDHINTILYAVGAKPRFWRPTRGELFDQVTDHEWQGCLEHPPHPNDVNDVEPVRWDPATWFLPYFAFDVLDLPANSKKQAWNDWLDDDAGGCFTPPDDSDFDANFDTTCKYGSPGRTVRSNGRKGVIKGEKIELGPNYYCTVSPLLPLTSDREALAKAIDGMGNDHVNITDLTIGLMWGWRALSPDPPLAQSPGHPSKERLKFIVLMSDGANAAAQGRGKQYGGWGMPGDGRLGPSIDSGSDDKDIAAVMDGRTLEACANAKRYGITIMSVNFGENTTGSGVLQQCASSGLYYEATDAAALGDVFRSIGVHIGSLRLTR